MGKHKWFLRFMLLLMIIIFLMVTVHYWNQFIQTPRANAHPKYYVTIHGNIEPHMPYPQVPMYKATYAAYNPNCGVWISRLEGVSGMAAKNAYYPVYPDAKGNYEVRIPIDQYALGRCEWKIAWVMQDFMKKIPAKKDWPDIWDWGDMIRFGSNGNPNEMPGYPLTSHATSFCGKRGEEYCTGNDLAGWYVNFVSRQKNYSFIQNIKNKTEKKNDNNPFLM